MPEEKASVGEMLGTLARDTGTLKRQELKLAAAEMWPPPQ